MLNNTPPANQLLVIFGASGDLAERKLYPSLFKLYQRGLLPESFAVLGVSRTVYTDVLFRSHIQQQILNFEQDKAEVSTQLNQFLQQLYYVHFDTHKEEEYAQLRKRVDELLPTLGDTDRILYYLATPPLMYEIIPVCLKAHQLTTTQSNAGWRRIIVEKPFGSDLASAIKLGDLLQTIFSEQDIYRIDHYLGKETVQNMLVLRFSNGIFEPLWNRNYIDFVEISAAEILGVEERGKYYDAAGALRDMIQNHLLQLMAFVTMEAPANFEAESIRNEVDKVFMSIRPYTTPKQIDQSVVRAQYTEQTLDGTLLKGYRQEEYIPKDSTTETFVAMKLYIDNWRWSDVPFFIRTGKCLPEKKSEITIHFKSTPVQLFAGQCSGSSCNKLTIRIQPDESISLKFGLKVPGLGYEVKQVGMDFKYNSLQETILPDAYERLLIDAMEGDPTLYPRSSTLQTSWRFIDPILCHWNEKGAEGLCFYPARTNGPEEQLLLLHEPLSFKNADFADTPQLCDIT